MKSLADRWIWMLQGILLLVAALAWFLGTRSRERVELKPNSTASGITGTNLLIDGVDHGLGLEKPINLQDQGKSDRDFSRLATTYYHREGPLGEVLEKFVWFRDKENTYPSDARLPASLVSNLAATYGSPFAPLATVWSEPPIGIVDLGVGTLASYARPLQTMDFYERNEAIKDLSFAKAPKLSA